MLKNKLLTLFLIISGCGLLSAQEVISNIDSLLLKINSAPEDTSKVIDLQKVAAHFNVQALDSAKPFADRAIALANKLDYKKGQWMSLNVLANYYERKTDYTAAMAKYEEALSIVEALNSTKGYAVVLNNIATVHIRQGEYDEALKKLFDALKAEEELENQNGIAQAYNNIGVVYYYLGDLDKTTRYLTTALEIQEELGNYNGLQNGYNNVGAIFDYQQKYDEAIQSYQKAYEISVEIGDKKEQSSNLSNIGLAYSKKKDFINAEDYFKRSIAIREEIKDMNGIAITYTNWGESLRTQKQFPLAEEYLDQALKISEQYNLKLPAKEALGSLAELAADQGDFQKSNEYLMKFINAKDSLLNEENAKIIAEVETKYETEKKEKEILKQRAVIAESELEAKRKDTMIYGGFSLALVLGLLGYLLYNQQRMKNRQLRKEAELKTALARIETQNRLQEQRLRISRDLHDNIGAQLTFIISSIDNVKYGFKDMSAVMKERLSGISSFTGQTIYELRDTIWAMNKNDISFEDLETRIMNFIEQARSASKNVNFHFNIADSVDRNYCFTSVDGMNLYRIIQEAVNNALKYSNAENITVDVNTESTGLVVKVMDDGSGFDLSSAALGNGLNNMKKRAADIEADIDITSDIGNGSSVIIKNIKS